MRPVGKVNLLAVGAIAAAVGGLWWVIIFSGVYLDNLDVKDAVASGYNAYNNRATKDEEGLRNAILGQCNAAKVGTHEAPDQFGQMVTLPGLGLTNDNVVIDHDEVRKTVKITVQYQRKVILKPSQKIKWVTFRVVKEGPFN